MSFTVRYLKEAYLHVRAGLSHHQIHKYTIYRILGYPSPARVRLSQWEILGKPVGDRRLFRGRRDCKLPQMYLMYLSKYVWCILIVVNFVSFRVFFWANQTWLMRFCCGILHTSLCWCFKIPKSRKVLVSIEARRHLPNQFGKEMQVNTEKCRYHT